MLSTHTLKRLLKSRDYVWKRMRRSARSKRNEGDFQTAKAHLDKLRAAGDRDFDLVFLNLNGSFESYVFEGPIDSEVLIKCFDDYCQRMKKPVLIVLDNAPVHTSAAFESRIESWQEQGLYLLFLPPYCPELNLIEILWRKIKYEWLPVSAYQSFKDLSEALNEVLKGVGSKYRLSFAH